MKQGPFVKIDSHAHITSDELYPEVDQVLKDALQENVCAVLNINTDFVTLKRALALKKRYPKVVFNTAAVSPHDAEKEEEGFFAYLQKKAEEGELVAIGETGLDYSYAHVNKQVQKTCFLRHIEIAERFQLPLIIHCRGDRAFQDLFSFAKGVKKGVIHCFTGTLDEAKEAIDRGWMISISGIATFKKSDLLRQVIEELPLDCLFIETDAPFLAPQSKRGKTNKPEYLEEIAEVIAETKGIFCEMVCRETTKNAKAFFSLPVLD